MCSSDLREHHLSVRRRLEDGRQSCRLFDTARYTRELEQTLRIMFERASQGLPPQTFAVDPEGGSSWAKLPVFGTWFHTTLDCPTILASGDVVNSGSFRAQKCAEFPYFLLPDASVYVSRWQQEVVI